MRREMRREMETRCRRREKKKKDRRDERRFDVVERVSKPKKSAGRIICSKVQNLILFSCVYLVRIRISGLRELIQGAHSKRCVVCVIFAKSVRDRLQTGHCESSGEQQTARRGKKRTNAQQVWRSGREIQGNPLERQDNYGKMVQEATASQMELDAREKGDLE